jgi:hypothetical protein
MNYAATAARVDRQLADKGQSVTVSRYSPTRNSTTGVVTKGVAALTGTAAAVEIPVTKGLIQSFTVTLDDAAAVAKTRRAFKVSPALGFAPLPRDEITLADGTVWPVTGCTYVRPDGTDLVYTVGVTK